MLTMSNYIFYTIAVVFLFNQMLHNYVGLCMVENENHEFENSSISEVSLDDYSLGDVSPVSSELGANISDSPKSSDEDTHVRCNVDQGKSLKVTSYINGLPVLSEEDLSELLEDAISDPNSSSDPVTKSPKDKGDASNISSSSSGNKLMVYEGDPILSSLIFGKDIFNLSNPEILIHASPRHVENDEKRVSITKIEIVDQTKISGTYYRLSFPHPNKDRYLMPSFLIEKSSATEILQLAKGFQEPKIVDYCENSELVNLIIPAKIKECIRSKRSFRNSSSTRLTELSDLDNLDGLSDTGSENTSVTESIDSISTTHGLGITLGDFSSEDDVD